MVKINDLKFSYSTVPVLENISMELQEGRIYGLLGENGVGKTTLLTLLCGLKKAQEGSIDVDGFKPYDRKPDFLSNIFFLPDEVAAVKETAESWVKRTGSFYPNFDFEKFKKIMQLFEVDGSKKMSAMSAGQLKKTHISLALSCGCKYLFMDEPTNALDIPGKAQFRSAIMTFTDEDSTIVISTHQVRDLENIIDPIIILNSKEVLLNATLEQISEKLFFDYGTVLHPESLYSEQIPGGFIQVYPNTAGKESKVNIEVLFNAAHNHKEIIKNLFV